MTESSPAARLPGALRPVAVVTGPTSGIGRGYAVRLASLGYDLVLVARDEARLAALAGELELRFGSAAQVLPADLATAEGRDRVAARLAEGVDFLVNNAGFGLSREFWQVDPELLQRQLDVNVTAVMRLTRAALPPMLAAAKGCVVNVASVAGLVPGRGSTYSASKAYVVSFSEGLAGGLAGTGVRVQALCPGLVRTEFHERAGIDLGRLPRPLWLSVDEVVAGSLSDLEKNRVISVPGMQYKAVTAVAGLMPRSLAARLNRGLFNARGRT
ncbi:SDR family NAD(P)-dependent oxidoreductase [Nocardia otitidiscaviarum]|uniref:SDR family NAD(P)-dependent oxidoreductase n=1 Tax=Nocardia otitidiscaviarum TaxID=1823 RepID=A0A378YC36_9NOCA|nr:SDR family NAD(P)-dependent oxidoreductase [Nocardia otitidiscaviarum]MBF6138013.1 SDR family NAD(P)-dependent oxidoreductase [Nocardia otitidiscaviarum]MBF6241723.1 SDR family NAD(P)-dependent oxidoreductase [Nocardia otitidiscaviarum]MBF6489113.1 SDR family NAD(P)-dependent oxidoreductase [Nocardia otitidiscaviarum]MCP9622315.1 SDR family NAD(P)-dependent oxidoreductase [Nocardia otitidiscaviarum]QDP82853.1 SDR family NAD(P)-dependent oxidoreductase [Nocardia otitidiscaviarum]